MIAVLRNIAIAGFIALSLVMAVDVVRAVWRASFGAPPDTARSATPATPDAPIADASAAIDMYGKIVAANRVCPQWRVNEGAITLTFLKFGIAVDDLKPGGRFNGRFQDALKESSTAFSRDPKGACETATKALLAAGWFVSS